MCLYLMCSVGAKPSLSDLLRHVVPTVAAKWKMVGYALGVEHEVLSTIEYDERKAERCAMELLAQWLYRASGTGDQPRTWHSVVGAVETVIGHGEKERIEAELKTLTTDSTLDDDCPKIVSICITLRNIFMCPNLPVVQQSWPCSTGLLCSTLAPHPAYLGIGGSSGIDCIVQLMQTCLRGIHILDKELTVLTNPASLPWYT